MCQIKQTKHDRYVDELCSKIDRKYDSLSTNVKVKFSKRCFGEIDVVAKKGDSVDLYEVKCSHRIIKARKQLKRMRKLLKAPLGSSYFYCGSSKLLFTV